MKSNPSERNKIFTMIPSPKPDNPYLSKISHKPIIDVFNKEKNTYHTINTSGELDFYFMFDGDLDELEESMHLQEEMAIRLTNSYVEISLTMEHEEYENIIAPYYFYFKKPEHMYNLKRLIEEGAMNVFYILNLEADLYACGGGKTILLPETLIYDLQRVSAGKEILQKPILSNQSIWASDLKIDHLLSQGTSFSFDFSAIKNRIEKEFDAIENEEYLAEEIISRHLFDSLAKLQRSKISTNINGNFVFWLSRSHGLNKSNKPCEIFIVTITGLRKAGMNIIHKVITELPEYLEMDYKNPLEEGAMPVIIYQQQNINSIKIDIAFYGQAADTLEYLKSIQQIKKVPSIYSDIYQQEMVKLQPISLEERRKAKKSK